MVGLPKYFPLMLRPRIITRGSRFAASGNISALELQATAASSQGFG
jgi:hypothetical protein